VGATWSAARRSEALPPHVKKVRLSSIASGACRMNQVPADREASAAHQRRTAQLHAWQGDFGNAYTDRNVVESRTMVAFFQKILGGLDIRRLLEVGCNRGHNLSALTDVLGPECRVVGVEPNSHAVELARAATPELVIIEGSVFEMPFGNRDFDLVMTAGVLIHIALADLAAALTELYRVSGRYILSIEYFAEREQNVLYRGCDNLLWKRNFLKHWQEQYPDLVLVRSGYEESWDRTHWWLLEKTSR